LFVLTNKVIMYIFKLHALWHNIMSHVQIGCHLKNDIEVKNLNFIKL
jgi:hypothetical protein